MHTTTGHMGNSGPPRAPEDRCERVRRILDRAGFDTSSRDEDGLRVWEEPEGVMVGWLAREVLRPTVQVHGHEEDLARLTSLSGLHRVLQTALAVILRDAGLDAAAHGDRLVVVRARPAVADGASAAPG
ncbi:hypothetical protein ACIA6E_21390 [Streptomyces sp. NPDC051815]|uniref:hypothetical protein n=1 Tax=Streptomyces sp. NPDC051815 TaxID=3365674 RepID=UPI00378E5F56